MTAIGAGRSSALAYREAVPDGSARPSPVLCLHGFPETSFMWRGVLAAAADTGYRALAPDLPGSGDSPADPPNTWERLVERSRHSSPSSTCRPWCSSSTTGAR